MARFLRSSLAGLALVLFASQASAVPMLTLVPSSTSAAVGDTITVDIFLDTDGLTLEGYLFALEFSLDVSAVDRTAADLSPLITDLFGPPTFDAPSRTFANIGQGSIAGSVAAGEFLIETVSFQLDEVGLLTVTPFFRLGDVLGVGGNNCPGAACPGELPTLVATGIEVSAAVPEPSLAGLLLVGALGAGALRRRLR